jgi:hypothetical protein
MRRTRMTNGNKKKVIANIRIALAFLLPITLYLIIYGLFIGCASMEFAYSKALAMEHKIHIQEGMTQIDCIYCNVNEE